MDALLISPDHGSSQCSFPWGVLAVGSYLTNTKKRDVRLLDASTLSESEFRCELEKLLPSTRLVGIGCFTTDVQYVKKLVDSIKETNPETKIIIGGPHAVLEPEQTCRYKNIDFVAYTEAEQTMASLIEEIARPNPNYEKVPGLIFKISGAVRKNPPPEFVGFYDTDYDLLPKSTRSKFHDYMEVITGRGCSYRCRFCYNSVICQTFHPRPAEDIALELEKIVEKYNPKVVYFRDENFFHVKKRALDFIRLYKDKGFAFRWQATCRANYFNERYINTEFVRQLESVNCEMLKMGIESGTQRVLDYLRKGISIDGIKRAVVEVAKSKSIKGNYSFIVGLPEQKVDDYIDTVKLIKFILDRETDAHIIGPQYFRIYPGGSLYEEIVDKYGYTEPASFEEWAQRKNCKDDPLGFHGDVEYPWIPAKGKYLALHGRWLVLLYQKPVKHFLTWKRFPAMPFVLLTKLRFKNDWYSYLYDIKLLVILYDLQNYFSRLKQSK